MRWLSILALMPVLAFAHGSTTIVHEHNYTTVQEECTGSALAIAKAQHQMDLSTRSLQGSLAIGSFKDCTGFSFMGGQRLSNGLLLNGSIGIEDGEPGYGAGVRWNF